MPAESAIPTELGPAIRALAAGQVVFDRYELRRKLGEGGFGAVWLVHDSALREEVALKFVLQAVAASPEAIDALKAEATRSRRLTHPNIVRIHDFVSDAAGDAHPSLAGITMEYVDGESLAQRRLREPGKCFDVEQIAPWIDQLCHALTYAHAPKRRVIHRDLKPPNLLLTNDGELKVADFGIACSLINSVTQISGRLSSGTPPFMSPQQIDGDWPCETDDVYSLGATIYMLLTGTPPFHQGDIAHQVRNKMPPPLRVRREQFDVTGRAAIPALWEETAAACLAKDAAQRPPTAEAVAERLGLRGDRPSTTTATTAPGTIRVGGDRLDNLRTMSAAAPDLPNPSAAARPNELSPPPLPPPRAPSRVKLMLTGAAAALVLFALVGTYLWLNPRPSPATPTVHSPTPVPADPAPPTPGPAAPPDLSSGVVQAPAVRLLFPTRPSFLNFDREKEWGILQAEAWGYLDDEGHEVIPAQWFAALRFSEGLAGVFRKDASDFSFIDLTGRTVFSAQQQWLVNGLFTEGRARVRHPVLPTFGYIDTQGQLVVPLQWEAADDFTEGRVVVKSSGKWAFLDLNGNYLTPPQWESASRFSEGFAAVQTGGQWGFIDRQGKLVLPAQWQAAYPFSEGLAAVAKGKKFGFINREGKIVIAPQWDEVMSFREGVAVVKDKGKCGFIDPGGQLVSPLQWEDATVFSESRAMVKRNGKVGYLDPLGQTVIAPQYDLAYAFSHGLAIVKRAGGKWGCIDRDGKTVIPFEWNYLEFLPTSDGRLFIALARLRAPATSFAGLHQPADVQWVDATGRVLWQSR